MQSANGKSCARCAACRTPRLSEIRRPRSLAVYVLSQRPRLLLGHRLLLHGPLSVRRHRHSESKQSLPAARGRAGRVHVTGRDQEEPEQHGSLENIRHSSIHPDQRSSKPKPWPLCRRRARTRMLVLKFGGIYSVEVSRRIKAAASGGGVGDRGRAQVPGAELAPARRLCALACCCVRTRVVRCGNACVTRIGCDSLINISGVIP